MRPPRPPRLLRPLRPLRPPFASSITCYRFEITLFEAFVTLLELLKLIPKPRTTLDLVGWVLELSRAAGIVEGIYSNCDRSLYIDITL